MDDVAVDAAIATEAVEETTPPAAKAAKPKRKSRAKVKTEAEVEEVKEEIKEVKGEQGGVPDHLLWAAVLKNHRTIEKEARSAKLSSLRIV